MGLSHAGTIGKSGILGLWTLEGHRRVEYVHNLVGLDGVWLRNLFG